jgi:hypothetical protein
VPQQPLHHCLYFLAHALPEPEGGHEQLARHISGNVSTMNVTSKKSESKMVLFADNLKN